VPGASFELATSRLWVLP